MTGMATRYLSQNDIARLLGAARHMVNVWRSRHKDFPKPDVEVGIGSRSVPGWLPERMDEIKEWKAQRRND